MLKGVAKDSVLALRNGGPVNDPPSPFVARVWGPVPTILRFWFIVECRGFLIVVLASVGFISVFVAIDIDVVCMLDESNGDAWVRSFCGVVLLRFI